MELGFGRGVGAGGGGVGPVHATGGGHQAVIPGAATPGMITSGMSSLLLGVGVPGGMVLPSGALASAGYGGGGVPDALRAAWNVPGAGAGGMAARQPRSGAGGSGGAQKAPVPHKGPWTVEEDDILRDMVRKHGERKWAVVAQYLPGRIGKQCRERWTNHLRPDIKKSLWTEEDDMALIEAHKTCGNRWSLIARYLPGRSENAVKNHWNATRRSLKAKRRLKKKKNAQPPAAGEFTVLEHYIRGLYPAPADPAAALPLQMPMPMPMPMPLLAPDSPPSSSYNHLGYGEVVSPPFAAAPGGFDAAGMGMYLNNAASHGHYAWNAGVGPSSLAPAPPLKLDLNAYYYGEMTQQRVMELHHQEQPQHQVVHNPYADLMGGGYPFLNNFMWQPPPAAHHGNDDAIVGAASNYYYYGEQEAGPGPSAAGVVGTTAEDDEADVVQMASREFLTPSEDEVTLDLARFM